FSLQSNTIFAFLKMNNQSILSDLNNDEIKVGVSEKDLLTEIFNNLNEDMEKEISLKKLVSDHIKFLKFKNSEDALSCLNNLIGNDSNDMNALLFRGMIHYSLHSYDDALNDLNRILSTNPNNISAINCRGTTYRMLKQHD